mmetsp:Transcript_11042/g.21015  ORF Transcript_11042/g.21015 Transcript_11042/m.21015 type:complete len:111 (-) Transcript_11042:240-572(-)
MVVLQDSLLSNSRIKLKTAGYEVKGVGTDTMDFISLEDRGPQRETVGKSSPLWKDWWLRRIQSLRASCQRSIQESNYCRCRLHLRQDGRCHEANRALPVANMKQGKTTYM